MNSFGVLYNGHYHPCENFAHAFLSWLHIMCMDRCIEGQLNTGAFLHQLYARLFPSRRSKIIEAAESADRRLRKYNPLSKFVDPILDETRRAMERNDMTQF